MQQEFLDRIKQNMSENDGKLSFQFMESLVEEGEVQYLKPTPSMRLCIITLASGHEVLGKAQILDPKNDVEKIGNGIAFDRAMDELWVTIGSIAKALQDV